jgi:hypothetical protein
MFQIEIFDITEIKTYVSLACTNCLMMNRFLQIYLSYVRFDVLTVASMERTVF